MCLLLPCSIRFLESLIVELLSQKTVVTYGCLNFNSSSILLSQIASQAHVIATTNSAFVHDKVTIDCFLDYHETTIVSSIKTYSEVLFLVQIFV